jgi:hypothetical protein
VLKHNLWCGKRPHPTKKVVGAADNCGLVGFVSAAGYSCFIFVSTHGYSLFLFIVVVGVAYLFIVVCGRRPQTTIKKPTVFLYFGRRP